MSSWSYLLLCLLSIVDHLFEVPSLRPLVVALVVFFLVCEFRSIPHLPRILGVVLCIGGIAAGWYAGSPGEALLEGIRRGQVFMVLFAAVAWLGVPVGRSPALRAAREMVVRQSPDRGYIFLAASVHLLGGVLNLAGVSLLSGMVGGEKDGELRRRLSRALMQGFTAASCWSPFLVSMAAITTVLPTIRWLDVAAAGLVAGALLVGCSWLMDRVVWGRVAAAGFAEAPSAVVPAARRRLAGILASLVLAVAGLAEISGLPIPIVLGLVGPPYALVWCLSLSGRLQPAAAVAAELGGRVMKDLPGFRSEAMVFVGANVFGAGIAAAISPEAVGRVLDSLAFGPDLKLFLLAAVFVACGALGLHPVIVVVVVGHVLPPEVLGVSAPLQASLMLAMWGLSTLLSPFSATTLYVSRIVEMSVWTLAWRMNPPYVLTASFLVCLLVVAMRHAALMWTGTP